MKTPFILLITILLLSACSEDKAERVYDPPLLAENPNIIIVLPEADDLIEYIHSEIGYGSDQVDAYPLSQFVEHDHPFLFEYELMSNDIDGNWSPRSSGLKDLPWIDLEAGYLIPSKQYRAFFPSDVIVNTYNVKFLGYLNLYRNLIIVHNNQIIPIQLNALTTTSIQEQGGGEITAVTPLRNFIIDYVTVNKGSYSYLLTFVEDEQVILSWDQLKEYYWIVDTEDITILTPSNHLEKRFSHLISITLSINSSRNTESESSRYLLN